MNPDHPKDRAAGALMIGSYADRVFKVQCEKLGIAPDQAMRAPLLVIALAEREDA